LPDQQPQTNPQASHDDPVSEVKEKLETLREEVDSRVARLEHKLAVEEYTLIALNVLAMLGVWVTNFRPRLANEYWLAMFVAFGAASVLITLKGAYRHRYTWKDAFIVQPLHWLGGIAAVLTAFALLRTGRLNYEGLGLVTLIILGLTAYLDGIRLGWRFSLTGLFLLLIALLTATLEQNLWLLLMLGAATIVVIVAWKKLAHWRG